VNCLLYKLKFHHSLTYGWLSERIGVPVAFFATFLRAQFQDATAERHRAKSVSGQLGRREWHCLQQEDPRTRIKGRDRRQPAGGGGVKNDQVNKTICGPSRNF
jgi:hypothetical protein